MVTGTFKDTPYKPRAWKLLYILSLLFQHARASPWSVPGAKAPRTSFCMGLCFLQMLLFREWGVEDAASGIEAKGGNEKKGT